METKLKLTATARQMRYLSENYCVKLYERLDKVEPKSTPKGKENTYFYKVLLRHPEGLTIPYLIDYTKLISLLKKAYKK